MSDAPFSLAGLLQRASRLEVQRPWIRAVANADLWREIGEGLALGRCTLLALWGEPGAVHAALLEQPGATVAVFSLDSPSGTFPSLGRLHRAAVRPERAMHELGGPAPVGALDARPWLDHGCWPEAPQAGTTRAAPQPYRFLPVEGEGLHQIPVGPIHAGVIEPGHFRFTANGETVVRLEERLGYTHKGTQALMQGTTVERAARLAARVSGDSTVAYGLAFAHAAETALALAVPRRALYLRGVMAELERLANHLGDIGAVCNDASFALMHTHCGMLRERILRAAADAFGHRLMMDRITPGGVAVDPAAGALQAIGDLAQEIGRRLPHLMTLYDETTSLQDRTVGTGVLACDLAQEFGCGGHVGRASGRDFDVRRDLPYAPYDHLSFTVPVLREGDVNARVWIRFREVEQSLSLLDQMLRQIPGGPVRAEIPTLDGTREGLALVESFRGDVLVWLRLGADGRVQRCHLRDPSWFQWPLLEVAIEGNIVADFPLCNKSFNCSYSGQDL